MPSRKRSIEAVDGDSEEAAPELLHRIRNMWQFANLCQWIYIFGKAAKIDESIDIEQIETECLKPGSDILADIALALLKLVSSHRGLTHEILDDQARKQYLLRAADRNPFGDGDDPRKFAGFDIITKIIVLQQLTQWIMVHPERLRDKMEEQKDMEQTSWRIEPYGWDSQDRTYFVLDDNRVYRLTEAPAPPPAKAKKSKSSRTARRSSKRRRTTLPANDEQADVADEEPEAGEAVDDSLGGMVWDCVAITLEDVRQFLGGLQKTRDENEKILRRQLEDHLVPILEKQEESRKRKEQQRERELLNLAKMANAKRSGRIAGKMEQTRQEQEKKEEEQRHNEAQAATRREEQARLKIEKERDTRLVSREKRLMEREARRILHEEELASLSEDSKSVEPGAARLSERRLQAEIERNRQALMDLEQEEEDWVFDCMCGMHGHVDDGTHSVACEKCNVWQHSKCLGVSEEEADRPEFEFVCAPCRRREDEANARPKPTIKLKLNRPADSGLLPRPESASDDPAQRSSLVVEPAARTDPRSYSTHPVAQSVVVVQGLEDTRQPVPQTPRATGLSAAVPTAERVDSSRPITGSTTQHGTKEVVTIPEPHNGIYGAVNLGPMASAGRDLHATDMAYPDQAKAASAVPATTPISVKQLPVSNQAVEDSLSTPHITRDIYRAAHIQNGALPSRAGYSPTKYSPQQADPMGSAKAGGATPILPPVALLSPSPREPILTPPTKPSEPMRQNGSH